MWREHLPYQGTIDVTASSNKVYAATVHSFFSVDLVTKEVSRFSKVSGLSETGISTLRFDPVSKKLFIAYSNSNIDVADEKGIRNIPDLKRENIPGDKTIYHIYPNNSRCYLSTGLGVIVLDADRLEIKDSWFIGNSGGQVRTNAFTISGGFFYAATQEGLKRTPAGGANPADFNNWQNLSGSNGLPAAPAASVLTIQDKTVVLTKDSLFAFNGAAWELLFANGLPILSVNVSENKLMVCQDGPAAGARVQVLDANGTVLRTIQQPQAIVTPKNAIMVNNEPWIADLAGLSHWTGNSFDQYKLNSPESTTSGVMLVQNGTLLATAGSVNDSWNYLYNRGGIFRFSEGRWSAYNQYSYPQLDTLLDFLAVAVDPRDGSIWGGSYGGGLLHIEGNNQLRIYKQNSPIGPTVGDPTSYRVAGLAFDAEQQLWVANFGADRQLHVRKNDGTWQSFSAPFTLNLNAAAQIVIDDANQKWIASPLGNGLMVFDHNSTLDNPNDDRWRLYRPGAGSGNLPSSEVTSLARDRSGFIWVGTTDGIGVIQCPQEAFLTGCDAIWPIIKDGNFANYLFKGQIVRSIAVDGADRKWIATGGGAWLVSPDGDKVIAHFTEGNSPLLSNDVRAIAIDGASGEVYFATANGICSFRGSSTEAGENKGDVLVYPNPVPPGFDGSIGIRGLPENSIIKITESNGRLVFQTRALGGQAIWNGRDIKGNKVATGIYLVLAVDEGKQEKAVSKIVFISR